MFSGMAHEILLTLDIVMLLVSAYVAFECIREKEQRASILTTMGVGFHLILLAITMYLRSLSNLKSFHKLGNYSTIGIERILLGTVNVGITN